MKKMQFSKGFTLVELMIVIAIIGALLVTGSALTGTWVDSSKVNNTASALKSAISQARVAALRNTKNKPLNSPAASVCLKDGSIKVILVGSNASLVCESVTSTLVQDMSIPKGISITQTGAAINCLTFGPSGLLLTFPGCSNNSNSKITVKRNGEESNIEII